MRRGMDKWEIALCLSLDAELRHPALYGLSAISNTSIVVDVTQSLTLSRNASRERGTAHWKPVSFLL